MIPYLTRRIGAPHAALIAFPRYFEIETVNACNARCPMCTIGDWDRNSGLMSDELFLKVATEIGRNAASVKRVHLYRDGEPLLDKKLAHRVRLLKDLGIQRVGISTNVALLTPAKSEELLRSGIDEVILSIDSLRQNVYRAIRVGLELPDVLHNAHHFIRERNRLDADCQVWVRMIRQESNKDEWATYLPYWQQYLRSSDRCDYRNIHNWGSQLEGFEPVAEADVTKPCVALWSLMVIFADGSVPRCNVDFNNKHPVGNVRDSSISELWQSQTQEMMRSKHLAGVRDGICDGCTVWDEHANG